MSTAPKEMSEREAFRRYLKDCDDSFIVPDMASAFHWAWRAALASLSPQAAQSPSDADLIAIATRCANYEVNAEAVAVYLPQWRKFAAEVLALGSTVCERKEPAP